MEETEAWVLHEGPENGEGTTARGLSRERFRLPDLRSGEVLVEPLFSCWEANYGHAIERKPIDICRARGEKTVVLGNCGVVRVLTESEEGGGPGVGEICILTANAISDPHGYMTHAHGYDARRTVGVMAKRSKAYARQLIPIGRYRALASLEQWAGFALRYITAWANWRVAHGAWLLQMESRDGFPVWSWGGGVGLAELQLAKMAGATPYLLALGEERRAITEKMGICAVDRAPFLDVSFDPVAYEIDRTYRERYRRAEQAFVTMVRERTGGEGAAIFIDNIGLPVFRATLRALSRQGVLATSGWKRGMDLGYLRASQCIARQTFVHTHYASHQEALDAVEFAVENGWFPAPDSLSRTHQWSEVGLLASKYAEGSIPEYFPVFSINEE